MRPKTRRSRRSLLDEELRSSVPGTTVDERLIEAIEATSLKDIPLEQRRKEANKPLFLTRYE